jgi:hypothetical protein
MKNISIILFVLTVLSQLIFSSCNKQSACDVKKPLKELSWLEEIVRAQPEGKDLTIFKCTYKNGLDGFYIEPCGNCYSYEGYLYNCDGIVISCLDENCNMKLGKRIYKNYK